MHRELTECYETSDNTVYRWNARTAIIRLEDWIGVMVPLAGDACAKELEPEKRERMARMLEAPPTASASITLGELLLWASRRAPVDDAQIVLGYAYSRWAIRESLQWLVQRRIGADATVELGTVPGANSEEVPIVGLRMRCGEWMGLVCDLAHTGSVGDDPLPTAIDKKHRAAVAESERCQDMGDRR